MTIFFLIRHHAHNDHGAVSVFGDKNGLFGLLAHLGDLSSVFQISDGDNPRHDDRFFLSHNYGIIILHR